MITAHYFPDDSNDGLQLAHTLTRLSQQHPGTQYQFYTHADAPAIGILQYTPDSLLTPEAIQAAWTARFPNEPTLHHHWMPLVNTPPSLSNYRVNCSLCGTARAMEKRVNADLDEIWVCSECPAVLFVYSDPAQLRTLATVLNSPAPNTPSVQPVLGWICEACHSFHSGTPEIHTRYVWRFDTLSEDVVATALGYWGPEAPVAQDSYVCDHCGQIFAYSETTSKAHTIFWQCSQCHQYYATDDQARTCFTHHPESKSCD